MAAAPASSLAAPSGVPVAWQPDQGDGTYRNPILHADYSDPDAIRVGDDYWMVASSFCHVPGLPVLHSKDLVNWELVTHALPRLVPEEVFSVPQHGKGVWAPSIRHHAGKFWIYYPDPDFGIYVLTARDPRGPWSAPILVKGGKGLIDPCPLWDDGKVYLIHAWAKSRSGICNRLTLLELSADGTRVERDHGVVIDGDRVDFPGFKTLEGPKFYKRGGWYYVFAPAGGVEEGWQSIFRARRIEGPYEHHVALAQGSTPINGPHQGGLVDTPAGESWFVHFQDKGAYGRIVHLQPVVWRDDWPVMGDDSDGDGTGQPVARHRKPVAGQPVHVPATSDAFDAPALGLQWQWQANPSPAWASLTARRGWLRLFAQPLPAAGNLFEAPALLLQKFPAESFVATVKLEMTTAAATDLRAGLIVFGFDYAWLGVRRAGTTTALVVSTCVEAVKGAAERQLVVSEEPLPTVWLRVSVKPGAECAWAWSSDGRAFKPVKMPAFRATKSRWVGAKFGLFASGAGAADFDDLVVAAHP